MAEGINEIPQFENETTLAKKPRPEGYFAPSLDDALALEFDPSEQYALAAMLPKKEAERLYPQNDVFPVPIYKDEAELEYYHGLRLSIYAESLNEFRKVLDEENLTKVLPIITEQANLQARRIVSEKLKTERNFIDARQDPLTGLPNRRAIHERLAELRSSNTPYGILLLDLDRFKSVNDKFGHKVGDNLLIQTSLRLMNSVRQTKIIMPDGLHKPSNLRETDLVGRYGGEEFIIVVSGVNNAEELNSFGERIVNEINKDEFHLDEITSINATTSVGGALPKNSNHDPLEVIKLADKNLYDAKENGRNQYIGPGRPTAVIQN